MLPVVRFKAVLPPGLQPLASLPCWDQQSVLRPVGFADAGWWAATKPVTGPQRRGLALVLGRQTGAGMRREVLPTETPSLGKNPSSLATSVPVQGERPRIALSKSRAQWLGRAQLIPIFKGSCAGAKHTVHMTRVALSRIPLHLPAHGKLQKFPCRGEQLSWVTWNYRLSRLVCCLSQDIFPVLLRTENNLLLLMTCLLSLIRD